MTAQNHVVGILSDSFVSGARHIGDGLFAGFIPDLAGEDCEMEGVMRGRTTSGHEIANFAGAGEGEYEEARASEAFWGSEVEGVWDNAGTCRSTAFQLSAETRSRSRSGRSGRSYGYRVADP